ncbi:hypothetical protein BHE74_00007690 [Ensete ventricosum]|nr:hypothetical protein GW17_00029891 [Ensete ventricosum]RWW83788.1 hypothetical protein BHE74_00007690 [Ensete ventricosum]RZR83605.1 hypothetical protein BHM03_00010254 [Ensete ventricosum]
MEHQVICNFLGTTRKQGGVSSIVQQSQEFSIQNEDFPALPGSKGSDSFHLDFLCIVLYLFIQNSGAPSIGLRTLSSPTPASGVGAAYEQLIQQYQHPQSQSHFRLQMSDVSQSYRDQNLKSSPGSQVAPDRFGLQGLLSVIRMYDPDLTSLALGIDLTTLGLNLNSSENLYKTFGSPWSDEPAKGEPDYCIPTYMLVDGCTTKSISCGSQEFQMWNLWLRLSHMKEEPTFENFVLHYEAVEKKPILPSDRPQL